MYVVVSYAKIVRWFIIGTCLLCQCSLISGWNSLFLSLSIFCFFKFGAVVFSLPSSPAPPSFFCTECVPFRAPCWRYIPFRCNFIAGGALLASSPPKNFIIPKADYVEWFLTIINVVFVLLCVIAFAIIYLSMWSRFAKPIAKKHKPTFSMLIAFNLHFVRRVYSLCGSCRLLNRDSNTFACTEEKINVVVKFTSVETERERERERA